MGVLLALDLPATRTADLFFSGLLLFWGVFLLLYIRARPQAVRGLTPKQIRWCSVLMISGGMITALMTLCE